MTRGAVARRALLAGAILAPCVVVGTSCLEATSFGVEVTTNIPCDSVDWTRLAAGAPGTIDRGPAQAEKHGCSEGYVGRLTIVPSGKGDLVELRVSLRARAGAVDAGGADSGADAGATLDAGAGDEECWGAIVSPKCVVARRVMRFVPHRSLPIKVFLSSACLGVTCPSGQTCGPDGKCMSACQEGCADDAGMSVDSGPPPDAPADAPPSIAAVTKLWAGGDGTCTLHADGFMRCWGDDSDGQLALPNAKDVASPRVIPNLGGLTDLALGQGYGCLRNETKGMTAHCFGADANLGRLGSPGPWVMPGGLNRVVTEQMQSLAPGALVAVGSSHACMGVGTLVKTPWCWGVNDQGQLGVATPLSSSLAIQGPSLPLLALTVGDAHTCAIDANTEQVQCWGSNKLGQCGPKGGGPTPAPIVLGEVAKELGAAALSTCAIEKLGNAYCWGDNATGLFGVDPAKSPQSDVPVLVPINTAVSHLTVGAGHACALDAMTRDAICWGGNDRGQLGDGKGTSLWSPPVIVPGPFVTIAAGRAHTCAVRQGGTQVACWGANDHGQLGKGAASMGPTFTPGDVAW